MQIVRALLQDSKTPLHTIGKKLGNIPEIENFHADIVLEEFKEE